MAASLRKSARRSLELDPISKATVRYVRRLRHLLQVFSGQCHYDPEVAHEMRILTRKCLAACRVLKRAGVRLVLGGERKLLRTLRRRLGKLRDADILLSLERELGAKQRANEALRGAMQLNWQLCHSRALSEIRRIHGDCTSMLGVMLQRLSRHAGKFHQYRWRKQDQRWLQKQVMRWQLEAMRSISDEAGWHAFRIRSKRLRYLLQMVIDQLPASEPWHRCLALVEGAQDALGHERDLRVALSWLTAFHQGAERRGAFSRSLAATIRGWQLHGKRQMTVEERKMKKVKTQVRAMKFKEKLVRLKNKSVSR